MKRHKLKKDLPTFKAGDKFVLDNDGNLLFVETVGGLRVKCPNLVAYAAETIEKFPNILTEWFEEIPEKPKTVWDLEEGDIYYIPAWDNTVGNDWWHDREKDNHRRLLGNMFLTEEEAEKELARRRAKQVLLRDTKGFKPDWESGEYDKFEVVYEYPDGEYNKGGLYFNDCNHCCSHADLWFTSREDAEASIKAHEREWKIYLGVEDE